MKDNKRYYFGRGDGIIKRKPVLLPLVLTAAVLAGCQSQRLPKDVTIGDVSYPITTTQLDLSGSKTEDLSVLSQFSQLQQLDLTGREMTLSQLDALQEMLPGCSIRWSVPIAGSRYDSDAQTLELTGLTSAELETLSRFPNLQQLTLADCEDAVIQQILETRPDLSLTYTVTIGSMEIEPNQTRLIRTDASLTELEEKLPLLPNLTNVILDGELTDPLTLAGLMARFPQVQFFGKPVLGGVETTLTAQTLDLTGAEFESTQQLRDWIPCFPNLTKVDLADTSLENMELDKLDKSFRNIDILWNVSLGPIRVSTGITHFMPYQYGYINLPTSAFKNLRYCHRVRMIDMGHCEVTNVDFVEFMPDLEYLLLCEDRITDCEAISKCPNLRYAELFLTGITDFYPLLNNTEMEDLNLSYDGCPAKDRYVFPEDLSPLTIMPWLHRLWMPLNGMYPDEQEAFRENLPGTVVIFPRRGSTSYGWRYCSSYYAQRDILGYFYMYK